MSKSPEEIKQPLVLKECERLFDELSPAFYRPYVGYPQISRSGSPGKVDRYTVWPFGETSDYQVHVYVDAPLVDVQWVNAYRLLNLEAKEIEERAKGLVKEVQSYVDTMRLVVGFPNDPDNILDGGLNTLESALDQWKGETNG